MSILTKIQTGRIGRAQKVVIYAPEGFGKSTLASLFPSPLFLDIEGSTSQLDVARVGRESLPDLAAVEAAITEIAKSGNFKTLVIDTADWLEIMAADALIAEANSKKIASIEDFGYGKGYTMLKEKFTVLLSRFDQAISAGVNVVMLAHSLVKKFEPPDGAGAYDRYELNLSKQVAPLLKEWADAVIFGNWRTQIRERDKNDTGQQFKGVGGKERKMFCNRCATHDAKNRHGLADEEPWHIDTIKKAFKAANAPWQISTESAPVDVVTGTPTPASPVVGGATPLENVVNTGDVAARILAVIPITAKILDEIPMESAEDKAFREICDPHREAVTGYLRTNAPERYRIAADAPMEHAALEYKQRVLKNPAGFLAQVKGAGK